MKVSEFFNSLQNREEIIKKVRKFKELKRIERFAADNHHCSTCGQALKFAHSSHYLRDVFAEASCCSNCGQPSADRKYSIN